MSTEQALDDLGYYTTNIVQFSKYENARLVDNAVVFESNIESIKWKEEEIDLLYININNIDMIVCKIICSVLYDASNHLFLKLYKNIIRLAITCPIKTIRFKLLDLLAYINTKVELFNTYDSSTFSVSSYISPESIPVFKNYIYNITLCDNSKLINNADKSTSNSDILIYKYIPLEPSSTLAPLFNDLYITCGRISNLDLLLSTIPEFFEASANTLHVLMREPGPLPMHIRHYIACMAASRFNCYYLTSLHEMEFLSLGGDGTWLMKPTADDSRSGIDNAPSKYKSLFELNALLASQPWLINKDHIARLLRPKNCDDCELWSVAELVQALVLLTTFHHLASVSLACGLNPEIDCDSRFNNIHNDSDLNFKPPQVQLPPPPSNGISYCSLECMRSSSSNVNADAFKQTNPCATADSLCILLNNTKVTDTDVENPENDPNNISLSIYSPTACLYTPTGHHLTSMRYEDFDIKKNVTFREHDYSWKEQGFALVNRFYPGFAQYLDTELDLIYELTYNNVGFSDACADTTPFRRALWYYSHRIFGFVASDFDYRNINQLVHRNLKAFIKRVVCAPETLRFKDFTDAFETLQLRNDEKLHVVLLASQAKRQACLLYGLNSLMKYVTAT